MIRLSRRSYLLVVVAGIFLCFGGIALGQQVQRMSLAAGPVGGAWYAVGAGMVKIINENTSGIDFTLETGGGVKNVRTVGSGRTDVGFTGSDNAYFGLRGGREFKTTKYDITALAAGHFNTLHIIVSDKSPVRTIDDLKGASFIVGYPGSTTEVLCRIALAAYGLSDKNMRFQWGRFQDASVAITDGRVTGACVVSGYPAGAVLNLAMNHPIRLLSVSDVKLKQIVSEHPYIVGDTIPAGTYEKQAENVAVIANQAYLVARSTLSEGVAYQIAKALFEHNKELRAVHPAGAAWTAQSASKGLTVPLHPGVKRYLVEKGVLK
jgi:uncharacterized protein